MLVVLLVFVFLSGTVNCGSLIIPDSNREPQLNTCVGFILSKFIAEPKKLTIIYINLSEDDELLLYIQSLNILNVLLRSFVRYMRHIPAYVIVASNVAEMIDIMNHLSKVSNWLPHVRYLILVRSLQDKMELQLVFDTLLQSRIYNVVVINGTETAELFTYNPFENYACGNFYTRLTEFGKCSDAVSVDLYPNKFTTGLRNCFLRVSCPDWAPYSIPPPKSDFSSYEIGTEQYIFQLMSEIEHFQYEFIFNYDPELFSTVTQSQQGVSVSGPLNMLQLNVTDVMLGGLVLTETRAQMFNYIHGYLDQVEDIRLVVKKASFTPTWKNFYIEFPPFIWILTLLVFIIYSFIIIIFLRAQDKSQLVLVLLSNLLLHGTQIKGRETVRIVFIFWVWFAYLINCFYQTSLMSLTTKPSLEHQIDNMKALKDFNLKPCISDVMQKILAVDQVGKNVPVKNDTQDESCRKYFRSLRSVGNSNDKYTAILSTIFHYYEDLTYDEYGRSLLHVFPRPFTKVTYALLFSKGFPLRQRFQDLAIRIRETGLSDRSLEKHYNLRKIKAHFHEREFSFRFSVPWYVYISGLCVSTLTFVTEILFVKTCSN